MKAPDNPSLLKALEWAWYQCVPIGSAMNLKTLKQVLQHVLSFIQRGDSFRHINNLKSCQKGFLLHSKVSERFNNISITSKSLFMIPYVWNAFLLTLLFQAGIIKHTYKCSNFYLVTDAR